MYTGLSSTTYTHCIEATHTHHAITYSLAFNMSTSVTSPRRLPSDPPEPDLSHLTEEERQIIESVLERQKAEAQKDQHMIR